MGTRRVFRIFLRVGGGILLVGMLVGKCGARNLALFDYTDPLGPTVYWSQDDLPVSSFPDQDRGRLSLVEGEFRQVLQRHFKRARDRNRFMTPALNHEKVEVYVIVRNKAESGSVSMGNLREEGRDIRAAREVEPLPAIGPGPDEGPDPYFYFVRKVFPFQFMRANLTVEVSALGRQATAQFITGPQEDVFLGADLPIDYFNMDGSVIPLKQQPKEFYLSVDYIPLGDAYIKDIQPLVHLFTKVSESPFDSIGIGIGARLPDMWDFMDLSNVTVTMNLLRTQGDGPEKFLWVCQVGYNLFSVFPGLFERSTK